MRTEAYDLAFMRDVSWRGQSVERQSPALSAQPLLDEYKNGLCA